MHQSHSTRDFVLARRSISLIAVAITALVFAVACNDNDALRPQGAAAGGGMGGDVAGHGGASGAAAAGTSGSSARDAGSDELAGGGGSDEVAGSGGIAGSAGSGAVAGAGAIAGSSGAGAGSGGVAGSAGSDAVAGAGAIAGNAGSDAVAGAGGVGPTSNCAVGGALFVVGNYADTAGNQFILRAAPKAATFALIPTGAAHPTRPPQLFLVKRVCAPGGALIASDGSSNYRVDFMQTGSQLAICWSGSVATLEAALVLPPADGSHAASTGCAGHAFTVYSAGTL